MEFGDKPAASLESSSMPVHRHTVKPGTLEHRTTEHGTPVE